MRKSFRLVLVAALAFTGAGLVAPSALASWSGPAPAAATPFRADDDDDGPPRVVGRDNENHNSSDNGSGCFYPPTRRPRVNLYDPNRKFRVHTAITLVGKATMAKCGIAGLTLTLQSNPKGGERGWVTIGSTTTAANGNFTFNGVLLERTTFFRVVSDPRYGFEASISNIVKVEKK